jgi:serine/threonine-protein kinase
VAYGLLSRTYREADVEGTPFGRYRLIELLGRGGMGEVWRAYDTATDRVVALKVLPANLADDPVFQERFRREARAAAGLDEPHIIPIHDFGEIDGRLYVTMRLIHGRDLQTLLADGPLSPARAVWIIEQVARAVQAAHTVGLVHRDIKPSNILLADDDFAYLIDFGIARVAGESGLTSTGATIGTWKYMAPERFQSGMADARADIYALACVLYESLTGRPPFPGDSLEQVAVAHMLQPPPQPSARQRGVSPQMDDVIATGMAKNPDQRYATTLELARAAREATTVPVSGPSVPVHRWSRPDLVAATPIHGQATQLAPTGVAPVLPPPPGPLPPQTQPTPKRPSWRRPRVAIPALAAVVVLIGGGAFAAVKVSQHHNPTAAPTAIPTAAAPPPNTGPFTGTFTAAMGPMTTKNGQPAVADNAPAFAETWHLRSACSANGCVATAVTGGRYPTTDLVFDNVGGRWLGVSNSRQNCVQRNDDEIWNVTVLQPQADGTMSGEWVQTATNGCFNKRTVTFTRTTDTDISLLPDPANLPPRVVSPAEALHGGYDVVNTYANGGTGSYHEGVRTDCLRTGDRCMSFFLDPKTGSEAFVFANGAWTRNEEFEGPCSAGGTDHVKITSTLPLPQPPQDPITLLTGHAYVENAPPGKCPSQAFNQKYTRTGD